MRLFEYEAKEIAKKYGIPVPRGYIASSVDEVKKYVQLLGGRAVLKSQVLVGRRGLAGGILFASSPEEAAELAKKLFSTLIRGEKVKKILVEEQVCIDKEYYISLTVDRGRRTITLLASSLGGVEIEELVKKYPEKLIKINIDPWNGVKTYMARWISEELGLDKNYWSIMYNIINSMWSIMNDLDAELVEFNPLARSCDGKIIALDAKIIIDDNSLYRHPEFKEKMFRELSKYEELAKKNNFSYVELNGDIGIMCNGAGLTMATMDLVQKYGGNPANFLDIGGGARRERVKTAMKILLQHPRTKVILVNIFGGITRCDEVALGIVDAIAETKVSKPIVVRMLGTNEELGRKILEEHGIPMYTELEEAIKKAIEYVRGG